MLRESHSAMPCHYFCLFVLFFSFFFFFLYSLFCILSALNKDSLYYYLDHSKLFLKLNNHNLGVQVVTQNYLENGSLQVFPLSHSYSPPPPPSPLRFDNVHRGKGEGGK